MEELSLSFNVGALEAKPSSDLETVQEGTNFYRLLPPYGTNHKGFPWAFHAVHWGFNDSEGNQVPVRCSYDKEKFCPVCAAVWDAEKEMEQFPKEDESEAKKDLENFINKYRADKAFYLNAVTADGMVKKLKLKPIYITGKRGGGGKSEGQLIQKLKEAINNLKFDPIGLDTGCWFKFTKTGKMLSTDYTVDFKRSNRKEGNRIIEEIDVTPLNEQFAELYEAIKAQLSGAKGPMFDVHTLYPIRSSVELKRYLAGEPVPGRVRSSGVASLSLGQLEDVSAALAEAPAVTAPAAVSEAVQVTAPVEAPVAPVVAVAAPVETKAPVQAPTSVLEKIAQERARMAALGLGKK
jgi:hypothetical protein